MKRTIRTALALLLVVSVLGLLRAQDAVTYYDRVTKKDGTITGSIKDEGPGGIKIELKGGKETKLIPPGEIRRVVYSTKEVDRLTFIGPFGKEERALDPKTKLKAKYLLEAQEGYAKFRDQVSRPEAKRYLEYKLATIKVLQAQDEPAQRDAAIKGLTEFKTKHPGGWQIMPALKTLARLQEESGNLDEARKSYEELAEVPDAPPELKTESTVLVGKLLLRAKKYPEAQARLEKLAGSLSRDDVFYPFVKIYLAESQIGQDRYGTVQKEVTEAIRGTADARLRGLGHNLLGDFYRKKGDQEEAFWNYLRVDTLYNEDLEEHARALYHLSTLFDKVKKDPQRAKDALARLLDARYAGTAFQKLAVSEGKKVTPE